MMVQGNSLGKTLCNSKYIYAEIQGWNLIIDAVLRVIAQILTLMGGIYSPLRPGSHGTFQSPFLASSYC